MFFLVKKNLQIGIGLINTVDTTEFKAILAHEFGHFSQKSMKVGSYVYNVNQVIYNMLYDNDGFEEMVQSWANLSNYFSLFVILASKLVLGIQETLKIVYGIVNKSYLGMSREMEFHADEVAANVTGSKPLITSLLRLDLADYSYNYVIGYYNQKYSDSIKTTNLYPQQQYVMNFLARENQIGFENNLPQLTIEHLKKYNKSKLVVKDQWASHPSVGDRIKELSRHNIPTNTYDSSPALFLFNDSNLLQRRLTDHFFSFVTYEKETQNIETEEFVKDYNNSFNLNSLNNFYNGYYDNKSPIGFVNEEFIDNYPNSISNLFSSEKCDLVLSTIAMHSDLDFVKQVANKDIKIGTFEYDGIKYSPKSCSILISNLEDQLSELEYKIKKNDMDIYIHFLKLAVNQQKENELKSLYANFIEFESEMKEKIELYNKLINETMFIHMNTQFDEIEKNINLLKLSESILKKNIEQILVDVNYKESLTPEIKDSFVKYISEDLIYFIVPGYIEKNLSTLFLNINYYQEVINKTFIIVKKRLLDFQVELEFNSKSM